MTEMLGRHTTEERLRPSAWQYDYLLLSALKSDIERSLNSIVPIARDHNPHRALDIGCARSPYKELLTQHHYSVSTLDLSLSGGADFAGTAEDTGLPAESFDLVLCTQVLEHTARPWLAMQEFSRILRRGGYLLLSVPHVWFYHPHPTDYWRMTKEGIASLAEHGGLKIELLLPQGGSGRAGCQVLNFLALGLLGRMGAPLFLVLNALGVALDRVVRDDRFTLNYVCLARKS